MNVKCCTADGPVALPPASLLRRIVGFAHTTPDKAAFIAIDPDGPRATLTYRQLVLHAASVASRLRATTSEESTVLICGGNVPEVPVAFLGALLAGRAALLVSGASPPAEVRALAAHAGPAAMIASDAMIRSLNDLVPACIPLSQMRADTADPVVPVSSSHARLLLQSSGTTGRPKIVWRSGDSLDAVSFQMSASIGFTPEDCVLATVPLTHSYGLEHGLLAPLYAGCTIRLCAGLDLPVVERELAQGSSTLFPGVPSIYEMLANHVPAGTRYPALRRTYSAGGPLPLTVSHALLQQLDLHVGQLYGATEIGSVTYGGAEQPHFSPTSVGRPMHNVSVRIDAQGQVLIRAASMFSGYLGESDDPRIDGYFPTGDLGELDAHGNLTITGRLKLLIDIGGLKVNPLEVEDVLSAHPQVASCIVVPIQQSQTVSRIKAIVIPTDPVNPPSPDELRQFARERLSSYKVPRVIEVREHLPRSATGKILRHLVDVS